MWEWDPEMGGHADDWEADTWRCKMCEKLDNRRTILRDSPGAKAGMKVQLFHGPRPEEPEHWRKET